jgi:Domain of unknown function (DUF4138)
MKMLFAFLTGCTLLSQPDCAVAQPPPAGYNKIMLKACCMKIAKDIRRIYFLSNQNGKMKLVVRGLYTRGTALFFALRLKNRSSLSYNIDSIGFFVMQKGLHKQPPLRLNRLSPVYVYDSAVRVNGFGQVTSVMVLPRPKLVRGQRLLIEVSEKNGGRQLQVLASHFILLNARLI